MKNKNLTGYLVDVLDDLSGPITISNTLDALYSPLLLTQAASADKSAGQFIFSLLDALHGADIFDVLRRVITIDRLSLVNQAAQ